MRMRVMLLMVVIGLAAPLAAVAQEPVHTFVLTDGFFQVGPQSALPVHLTHDQPSQSFPQNNSGVLWYQVAVRPGYQNLCSEREVTKCEVFLHAAWGTPRKEHRFAGPLAGTFGESRKMSGYLPFYVSSFYIPKGDVDLVMTIRKNGIELFAYKIPLKVQ